MPADPFLPHIRSMEGYVPGEQPGDGEFLKLNTNENPYPPSDRVIAALRAACDGNLKRYPDPDAVAVLAKLSERFGLPAEQIAMGNGSDELLNAALRCFAGPGQPVAIPFPTYPYYQKLIDLQNADAIRCDLDDDFGIPAGFPPADARLTLLANPNSPTGTAVAPGAVEEMASRTRGVLLVDEAYVDFSDGGCIDLVERYPNLLVTRTMSKSFSLAALRIGFCFGPPDLIAGMRKVLDHYNMNALSQAAAAAALDGIEEMRANAARIRRTRQRLTEALRGLGFRVWDSEANFVLARIESPPAEELYLGLKERRILVRWFSEPRLRDCLRISVGTDAENERLLRELAEQL